jgi:primosomal protein N' (replication factor Y)
LPLPLAEPFDYAVPDGLEAAAGDHVCAPLGTRTAHGVVLGVSEREGVNRPLKPLEARLDETPLPPGTLEFVDWAARYSADAPGCALSIALKGLRAPRPRPERKVAVTGHRPEKLTEARARVLDVSAERGPLGAAPLSRAAGVGAAVVKALVEEGALHWVEVVKPVSFPEPDLSRPGAVLNESQAAAAAELCDVTAAGFNVALLDGVTGSGKTEVYLEAVAAALAADPEAQVLVLLPEIALTQAVLARFKARFGVQPAEWHSAVSGTKRRRVWEAVAGGRARIVVGARSALFLPFAKLRLIVVDEEHDGSYKQEDGFIYHARDFAVARGKIEGAAVVLASATPSLETLRNAEAGRYRWIKLGSRHGAAVMPEVSLIDLRETPPERGRWLSPPLVEGMVETLARGEQVLLFLNRRGYAPVVLCTACGQKMTAPDTDSWLVEHRYTGRLVCHLTGFSMPKPDRCPHCAAVGALVSIGPGVERVEEEVRDRFPTRAPPSSAATPCSGPNRRAPWWSVWPRARSTSWWPPRRRPRGTTSPSSPWWAWWTPTWASAAGTSVPASAPSSCWPRPPAGRAGPRRRTGHAPDLDARALGDAGARARRPRRLRGGGDVRAPGRGPAAVRPTSGPDRHRGRPRHAGAVRGGPGGGGPQRRGCGRLRPRRRAAGPDPRPAPQAVPDPGGSAASTSRASSTTWRSRVKIPGSVRLTVDIDPYSFL